MKWTPLTGMRGGQVRKPCYTKFTMFLQTMKIFPLLPGDGCRLENKKKGICRRFGDCPAAIRDVAEHDKWPLLCQYEGDASTSIVCCDELGSNGDVAEEQSTTPKTTTTSTPSTTVVSTTTRKSTTMQWVPTGIVSRRSKF